MKHLSKPYTSETGDLSASVRSVSGRGTEGPPACPCTRCGGTGIEPVALDPAALIAAIADAVGLRVFTCRELVKHAEEVDGPLRAALAGKDARKLGKALRRIESEGQYFDDLTVVHDGGDREGAFWFLRE